MPLYFYIIPHAERDLKRDLELGLERGLKLGLTTLRMCIRGPGWASNLIPSVCPVMLAHLVIAAPRPRCNHSVSSPTSKFLKFLSSLHTADTPSIPSQKFQLRHNSIELLLPNCRSISRPWQWHHDASIICKGVTEIAQNLRSRQAEICRLSC